MTDLSFHVRQFVPECDGEELEHRTALIKARDYAAMLRARTASRTAFGHAVAAHEMAGAFVWADASLHELKEAVSYCRHLVQAAFIAERLDSGGGVQ